MGEHEGTSIDRRRLLGRAIWGTAGVAAVTTAGGLAVAAAPAGAASGGTATFDVACLLNTFTPIVAPGATAPFTDFRGTTFFVEGDLYPAGTIPDGVTDWDPDSATPTGHWLCRGWFINRMNRAGEEDRPQPHVVTHQEYLLSRIVTGNLSPEDQLTSSGLEGIETGEPAVRSVIGGTGAYMAAQGAVLQHVIGSNTTGGPNFRFVFTLVKHGM